MVNNAGPGVRLNGLNSAPLLSVTLGQVTLSKHLVSSAVNGDGAGSYFLGLSSILNEATPIKHLAH